MLYNKTMLALKKIKKGSSIKYFTLFLISLTPPYHTWSQISEPPKISHTLELRKPNDCPTSMSTSELCNDGSIKL